MYKLIKVVSSLFVFFGVWALALSASAFDTIEIQKKYISSCNGEITITDYQHIETIEELYQYIEDSYTNLEFITGEQIAEIAKKYEGYKYKWGGSSPSGFDCSGFVYYVYKEAGLSFPLRTKATTLTTNNTGIYSIENLLPGDIVFFGSYGISHWGIYIGENQVIHSYNYKTGVVVTDINKIKPSFKYGCRLDRLMESIEITVTIK